MPVDCESEFYAMAKLCGELIVHRYRVTATSCSELGLEYVPWITRASVNTTHNVTTGEKEEKTVSVFYFEYSKLSSAVCSVFLLHNMLMYSNRFCSLLQQEHNIK